MTALEFATEPDTLGEAPAPGTGRLKERTLALLPAFLLSAFALLTWMTRAPGVRTRQDDARYILLAHSIQSGSYRDVLWPGAPLHHMYPPGYPALLAGWMAIGGTRFDWLVVLQILLSVAALALMYGASRIALSRSVALWSLAILAVSPWFIDWTGRVASEGALAACVGLAIWASVALPRGRAQVAIVIVAAILAPFMRAAGLAITAAVFAQWLLERRYRDLALLSAFAVPIVGAIIWWTIRDPSHVPGSSYVGDLALAASAPRSRVLTMLHRFSTNANYYATRGIPVLLAAPTIEGTIIDNVVTMVLTFVALSIGAYRAWYQFRSALLVLAFSAALLMVWPYYNARFAVPLLPVIVPVMLDGMGELGQMIYERFGAWLMVVVALAFTLTGITTVAETMYSERDCVRGLQMPPANCINRDQASFFRAVVYIRDHPACHRTRAVGEIGTALFVHASPDPSTRRVGASGQSEVLERSACRAHPLHPSGRAPFGGKARTRTAVTGTL